MSAAGIVEDILLHLQTAAFFASEARVPTEQAEGCASIAHAHRQIGMKEDALEVRKLIESLYDEAKIDYIRRLSSHASVSNDPKVKDFDASERYTTEMERAVREVGGPRLGIDLSAVERHRGVRSYQMKKYAKALEHFDRSLGYHLTGENIANVLCTLLRMGEVKEARLILRSVRDEVERGGRAKTVVAELNEYVQKDPDLLVLRIKG